ncbi:MAG: hypothetical protein JWL76_1980 [Thermoleophilia bacterium]|nr:hypothetical protein [Thermoleophilia bacterium]
MGLGADKGKTEHSGARDMARKHGHWGFTEEAKEWASRARRIQGKQEVANQSEDDMAPATVEAVVAELLTEAAHKIDADDPEVRTEGWAAIGTMCNGLPENVGAAWEAVRGKFDREETPEVIEVAVSALGHMAANDCVSLHMIPTVGPLLMRHVASPSADVRLAVAEALPWFKLTDTDGEALTSDPLNDSIIEALIRLSGDSEADVRDWATFGLGQLPSDTKSIRAALTARLADTHDNTRAEAQVALAKRRDQSALPSVKADLESESVGLLAVEAAAYLEADELLPALRELESWWDVDEALLATALRRCDPSTRQSDIDLMAWFSEQLEAAMTVPTSIRFDRDDLDYTLQVEWVDAHGETERAWWSFWHLLGAHGGRDKADDALAAVLAHLHDQLSESGT